MVFGSGGSNADGIQFESLNMFKLDRPGPGGLAAGVGLFLAFWSWVGFEAIPNYAEESKNPKKIIPRATLISVVGARHRLRDHVAGVRLGVPGERR